MFRRFPGREQRILPELSNASSLPLPGSEDEKAFRFFFVVYAFDSIAELPVRKPRSIHLNYRRVLTPVNGDALVSHGSTQNCVNKYKQSRPVYRVPQRPQA